MSRIVVPLAQKDALYRRRTGWSCRLISNSKHQFIALPRHWLVRGEEEYID